MYGKSFHIVGDGAAHSFANGIGQPGLQVKWWQIVPAAGNSLQARIGASEVSSSVGFPVPASGTQFAPAISELSNRYDLDIQKYWMATGDVIDGLYGID